MSGCTEKSKIMKLVVHGNVTGICSAQAPILVYGAYAHTSMHGHTRRDTNDPLPQSEYRCTCTSLEWGCEMPPYATPPHPTPPGIHCHRHTLLVFQQKGDTKLNDVAYFTCGRVRADDANTLVFNTTRAHHLYAHCIHLHRKHGPMHSNSTRNVRYVTRKLTESSTAVQRAHPTVHSPHLLHPLGK
jgi:hypothetical protein